MVPVNTTGVGVTRRSACPVRTRRLSSTQGDGVPLRAP